MPVSAIARIGPKLRSPSGGYFATAAKARASAAVLMNGAMIPSQPTSSRRLTVPKSFSATRTIGAAPPLRIATIASRMAAKSQSPCCASSVTVLKPSRAIISATIGAPSPHQAECTISPARSRAARENPGTAGIRASGQPLALISAIAFSIRSIIARRRS